VSSPRSKPFAPLLNRLPRAPAYWVAYSGGIDSHVLLHLLNDWRARLCGPLGAVHVNHQLQQQSGDWEIHCRAVCKELGVDFEALDGEPAYVFFLLVSPANVSGPHIKALARISRLLKNDDFKKRLIAAGSSAEISNIIKAEEENHPSSS
jgi:tRNA(Ile)-lysidine synthase TilS/MesJ